MMTLRAYFDGKVFVPRERVELSAGQDLVITIESARRTAVGGQEDLFAPLSFKIDPETSRRIAEDPEFDVENS